MGVIRRPVGPSRRVDPTKPHQFLSIDEVAAMAAGSGYGQLQGPAQSAILALAADAWRERCRLPGCGKSPDDPVHA